MKKILTLLTLIFIVSFAFTQENTRFSLNGNTILNPKFSSYSLNPSIEIGLGEHWNIHYSIGFGVRGNNKFYMHMPASAPLGMIAFIAGLGTGGGLLTYAGILLIVLPEGVSYDIPLNEKWELTPFINLNSAECFTSGVNNEFNYLFSADGGVAARYYFSDKFFGQVYSAAKIIETKAWGVSGGFGFGFTW